MLLQMAVWNKLLSQSLMEWFNNVCMIKIKCRYSQHILNPSCCLVTELCPPESICCCWWLYGANFFHIFCNGLPLKLRIISVKCRYTQHILNPSSCLGVTELCPPETVCRCWWLYGANYFCIWCIALKLYAWLTFRVDVRDIFWTTILVTVGRVMSP